MQLKNNFTLQTNYHIRGKQSADVIFEYTDRYYNLLI